MKCGSERVNPFLNECMNIYAAVGHENVEFSIRDAQTSGSEGEEKKAGTSASAAEGLPEMSADSKRINVAISFGSKKKMIVKMKRATTY